MAAAWNAGQACPRRLSLEGDSGPRMLARECSGFALTVMVEFAIQTNAARSDATARDGMRSIPRITETACLTLAQRPSEHE